MNLTQIIGVNILTILTFVCGYLIGYIAGERRTMEDVKKNIKRVVQNVTEKGRVGAVKRPTQQQIQERKDPWHKKLKGGMDEMKKTLDVLMKKDEE